MNPRPGPGAPPLDVGELTVITQALQDWLAAASGQDGVELYLLTPDGRSLAGPQGSTVALGEGPAGLAAMRAADVTGDVGQAAAVVRHDGATVGVVVTAGDRPLPDPLREAVAPLLALARRWAQALHRATATEQFAEQAVAVQEAERSRLAREIHDGVAQRLAGLGFHLSAAAGLVGQDDDAAREQIGQARHLADLAGAEARAAIGDLHPPVLDDLGLAAALASLVREAGARPGAPELELYLTGELEAPLPDHVQTALYRIAQEAIGNAVRHAEATCVSVALDYATDAVRLEVADDGRGFAVTGGRAAAAREDSFGLRSMRERTDLLGGALAGSSSPGRGTTVSAALPLTAGGDHV